MIVINPVVRQSFQVPDGEQQIRLKSTVGNFGCSEVIVPKKPTF